MPVWGLTRTGYRGSYMKSFKTAVFILVSTVILSSACIYAQDVPQNSAKVYSEEQVAKQNILTIFGWIEKGSLGEVELKNISSCIKEQLQVLKKECASVKGSCGRVYGYLDDNFLSSVTKEYKWGVDYSWFLNSLFIEAAGKADEASKVKVKPNKSMPEAVAKHPWLDIRNNLVDCLENEVIISFPAAFNTNLTKPEILVAPDISFTANLMEKALTLILKNQLNISGAYRLVFKGSTSRGTSLDNADFDFDLLFDNQEGLTSFFTKVDHVIDSLSREYKAQGYIILSKYEYDVPKRRLVNLLAQDKNGVVFRMQLLVGIKTRIYVDMLNSQIAQIKALGGSWEYVSGQIIMFKRLAKDVLRSYGKSYDNMTGPECEQFIIQASNSLNHGEKIISIGSFDKTMRWLYKVGFDQASSTIIPLDMADDRIAMYIYPTKENVMKKFSPILWKKLVNASRRYVALNKIDLSEDEFASLGKDF